EEIPDVDLRRGDRAVFDVDSLRGTKELDVIPPPRTRTIALAEINAKHYRASRHVDAASQLLPGRRIVIARRDVTRRYQRAAPVEEAVAQSLVHIRRIVRVGARPRDERQALSLRDWNRIAQSVRSTIAVRHFHHIGAGMCFDPDVDYGAALTRPSHIRPFLEVA